MRSDMKDLIVNTGRVGGKYGKAYWSRAHVRDCDPDDLPTRIPSGRRRQYGYNCKELGDRIGPLRDFLRSCVGRPWDDVYSEICAHADPRTIRGYHLRQHVWSEVEVKPNPRWGPWGFYVDEDGILRDARPSRTKAQERRFWANFKPTTHLSTEDPDFRYEKIDGFWYSFQTEHIRDSYKDQWLETENGNVVIREALREYWRHVTTKKQVDAETGERLDGIADERDRLILLR